MILPCHCCRPPRRGFSRRRIARHNGCFLSNPRLFPLGTFYPANQATPSDCTVCHRQETDFPTNAFVMTYPSRVHPFRIKSHPAPAARRKIDAARDNQLPERGSRRCNSPMRRINCIRSIPQRPEGSTPGAVAVIHPPARSKKSPLRPHPSALLRHLGNATFPPFDAWSFPGAWRLESGAFTLI